jgi:DNA polymerase epsilon subunit 2
MRIEDDDEAFVVLSDVHLDQPRILQQLEGLFASYENYSPDRLPLFVLMGNFCSQQSAGQQQHLVLRSCMDELLSLIAKCPVLAAHAHFCIVPGPADGLGSYCLPFPPLLKSVRGNTNKVAHVHFCSNPCRIRWAGKEVVIFRYDLLHVMQRNQVLLQKSVPKESLSMDEDEDDGHYRLPHCRLVKTLLDQGHLMPCAGVPIFWNYDHALSLYPLPDGLILGGDAVQQPWHEVYGKSHVLHAGSALNSYAVLTPGAAKEGDDSSVDNEEEGPKSVVEFCTFGGEGREE